MKAWENWFIVVLWPYFARRPRYYLFIITRLMSTFIGARLICGFLRHASILGLFAFQFWWGCPRHNFEGFHEVTVFGGQLAKATPYKHALKAFKPAKQFAAHKLLYAYTWVARHSHKSTYPIVNSQLGRPMYLVRPLSKCLYRRPRWIFEEMTIFKIPNLKRHRGFKP